MNDWLVKLAAQQPTNEEQLMDALGDLSVEELQEIAAYDEPPAENLQSFEEKLAEADRMGRELAHLHGDELEKRALAFLAPLAGMAARAVGGKLLGSAAKSIAGNVAGNVAGKAIGALGGGGGGQPAMAAGGFKYAGVLTSAAGAAAKKPGGGMLGNMVKDHLKGMAVDKATSMLSGGGRAAAPAAQAPAQMMAAAPQPQGFSYGTGKFASVRELYIGSLEKNAGWADSLAKSVGSTTGGNSFLRGAAAKMMRNPAMATAAAGAALGIGKGLLTDPGVDPQTGMPRSRIGAALRGGIVGGGLGYAGGKFIPGAAQKVQGLGKELSGSLRSAKNIEDMTAHAHATPPPTPAGKASTMQALSAAKKSPANDSMKIVKDTSGLSTHDPFVPADFSNLPGKQLDPGIVDSSVFRQAQQAGPQAPQPSVVVDPAARNMASGSRGDIRSGLMTRRAMPGNSQSGEFMAKGAMSRMTPVERIKLAMLAKQSASPMFSTRISPAAAGQAVRSGFSSGIGGAMQAASRAAGPAKAPAMPAARPAAGGGLAAVQKQLNSAQSIAGGGPVGMHRATISAAPGSGW